MEPPSNDWTSKLSALIGPALNLIPYVGSPLGAAYQEFDSRRRFARIEEAIRYIQGRFQEVVPNGDAASEAGIHLLELVLRSIEVEHCERKRKRLANILVAAWIDESPIVATFDEFELFLRATKQFGEVHIAVLNKLHSEGSEGSVPFDDLKALVADPEHASSAALIAINDICSGFGMGKRAWDLNCPEEKGRLLSANNLSPEGIARKCRHAATKRGMRYVDFIVHGSDYRTSNVS